MNLTAEEFIRLANNFYNANNQATDLNRIALDSHLFNFINGNAGKLKKFKVAFCCICLNGYYWEFIKPMIQGAKQFFLPGHDIDFFLWSDIPSNFEPSSLDKAIEKLQTIKDDRKNAYSDGVNDGLLKGLEVLQKESRKMYGATIFPTEAQPWPLPTLMRYHLFLQQEEILKDYDYIFYCDVDMKFVNVVGDEILGIGLTAALHPGYATDKKLWPPYEPNKDSHSFIQRPGMVIQDEGKPRFMPMYFAGGLQGGKSDKFISAMKAMKNLIDKDMAIGYTPIWNDETAWNKYLEKTPLDTIVLPPSYIYHDSLIEEYYVPKVWGVRYPPKLITLTKKFSVSPEGGAAVAKMIQ